MSEDDIPKCECCGLKLNAEETPCYLYTDNGGAYDDADGVCYDCYWKLIKLYKKNGVKFRKGKGYHKCADNRDYASAIKKEACR